MTSRAAGPIESLILTLRGERVILDADLAQVYGVSTSRFNEAVKRNECRFPVDFRFQLTKEEWNSRQSLRSQNAILDKRVVRGDSSIPTKTGRGRYRKYLPYAFTEHGALMAANILNSPKAVEMSVYVIRAFIQMRRELTTNEAVERRLDQIERSLLAHDAALKSLFERIRPLLTQSIPPKRRQIGFHAAHEDEPDAKEKRAKRR